MAHLDFNGLTLETLITRLRDRYSLRYATAQDVDALQETAVDLKGKNDKGAVANWMFITLEDALKGETATILTGVRDGLYWVTSQVMKANIETGWVITKSGSLYHLQGPAMATPVDIDRLMHIAAVFNGWGIGQPLGMPLAFL